MRELIKRLEEADLLPGESVITGVASKSTAIRKLYKLVGKTNDGFFKDQYWQPINKTFEILRKNNIDFVIQKSEYEQENGTPVRKIWYLDIEWVKKNGRVAHIYGTITAAGAGTVQDPLDRYDVTLALS